MIFIVVGVGVATLAVITGSEALATANEWLLRLFSLNF
jgi:hypothetical protein